MAEQKPVKTHNLKIKIREKCLEKGFATAYQLQVRANLAPSVAQNLFNENFSEISLQTLEKLLEALDCDASDLFVKEPGEMQKTKDILKSAKRVLVLTGAGVSAESNVPTFRGGGGSTVWRGIPFEQLSSAQMVKNDLPLVWEWFDYRRGVLKECSPNAAHRAVAVWQREGDFDDFTLVTQNIDGLHREAGSTGILELHGNIWQAAVCLTCKEIFDISALPSDERPPVCNVCGDSLRPNVVLFGENLSAQILSTAFEKARNCDVCLVVGTSSLVYPAARLPEIARRSGAQIIEINPEDTALTAAADVSIRGRAGEILPQFSSVIIKNLDDAERSVSQTEAAQIKSGSRQCTQQLIKDGQLPSAGEGHNVRIKAEDLTTLTEGKKGQPRKTNQNEQNALPNSGGNASTVNKGVQIAEVETNSPLSTAMTSETHPIRVDFVESVASPALRNLGMTFAPGKKQPHAVSGEWRRDLTADLLRLRDFYKVDVLVSLIEERELGALGISDLEAKCSEHGIEIIRYPIKDYSVPTDAGSYIALIEKIVEKLEQDKRVVIHCKGGLGRAGMTAACTIVAATEGGIRGAQAVETVRTVRHKAVETAEQEKFVQAFFEEWQKRNEKTPEDQTFPEVSPIGNIKVIPNGKLTEADLPVEIGDEWEIFALSFGAQDYSKLNEEAQEIYDRTGNLDDLSLDQLRGALLAIQRQKYWSFGSGELDDSSIEFARKLIGAIRRKVKDKNARNVLTSGNMRRGNAGIFLDDKDESILDKVWEEITLPDSAKEENKSKTLVLTFVCEGGGVDIYRRKNQSGEWTFFSEGSDLDEDEELGVRNWTVEAATIDQIIKENISDYQIFIMTPLYIHPEHRSDVQKYLEVLYRDLNDEDRERLQQFAEHSAITPDDWIKRAERKMNNR